MSEEQMGKGDENGPADNDTAVADNATPKDQISEPTTVRQDQQTQTLSPAEEPTTSAPTSSAVVNPNDNEVGGGGDIGAITQHPEENDGKPNSNFDAILAELLNFGFDPRKAALALRTGANTVEQAANWLIDNDSIAEQILAAGEETEQIGMRQHKMVFVVNTSLEMGTGKVAAQVAHAAVDLYRQMTSAATNEIRIALQQWEDGGAMKIVLKTEGEEALIQLQIRARDLSLPTYVVQDAGRTQIPAGSRTVLGIFGLIELVDTVTGHLKLL